MESPLLKRYRDRSKPALSFEVFPPKTEKGMETLCGKGGVIEQMVGLQPVYISCTYGADGSNIGRNLEVLTNIRETEATVPVTHFTCIGATEESVEERVSGYLAAGVDHMLALRGDLPVGWSDTHGDFRYAVELIAYLRKRFGSRLTIACSGMPESHIETADPEDDIRHLKEKQDAGADFIMTQLTWDMDNFARWLDKIRAAGVTLPVDVGVMPVLDAADVLRMSLSRNGCAIPAELARLISKYWVFPTPFEKDPPDREAAVKLRDFREAGIEYTLRQIEAYRALGVEGIHLYALNRFDAVGQIVPTAGL
ncbi:MAG: methylenetetrahydrofolate reductase [Clostridia bacterium]|nr:methylenetetrahydrofolate reductase [Clostridia bacterium]